MMYLTIIFVSPLYFMIRGKWGAFILNAILYVIAIFTVFFGIGIIFWALGVGHAGWHLRKELMEEHAEIMATKMAEKMVASGIGSQSRPIESSFAAVVTKHEPSGVLNKMGAGICPNCSGQNPPASSFCGHCGARLN